jgi:hypothetical protein
MKDRNAANPNRYLVTPETGSPYYATIQRADNPTEEGTPYNKISVLRDATATALGLTAAAVPDDAFNAVAAKLNALGSSSSVTFGTVTAGTVIGGVYQ